MSISFDSSATREPIVIIRAADDNYLMPVAAILHSAIVNLKSKRDVSLFIIDGGISRANKCKIVQSIPSKRASLTWLRPKKALFKDTPTSQSITITLHITGFLFLTFYHR